MKFFKRPFTASMRKLFVRTIVSVGAVVVCLLCVGFIMEAPTSSTMLGDTETSHVFGSQKSSNKLLSIKIVGTIIGDKDDTGLLPSDDEGASTNGFTSGYEVKQLLYNAVEDDTIKGVVLEINSGGGTIYGAHAIADGVEYYRSKMQRPVYTHIQGFAASGALWAAVSTDKIYADYGSSIGSIGVIVGPFKYYDKVIADGSIMTQNGVESITISAGKSKDIGDPYRRLTDEETAALRQGVNNDYDDFVQYISKRRGISVDTIRNQIGAMIYDGKTAKSHKLIDDISSREQAYNELAKTAQIDTADYSVIRSTHSNAASPEDTSGASVRQSRASGCVLHHVRLAYYGDISRLCE